MQPLHNATKHTHPNHHHLDKSSLFFVINFVCLSPLTSGKNPVKTNLCCGMSVKPTETLKENEKSLIVYSFCLSYLFTMAQKGDRSQMFPSYKCKLLAS